MEATLARPRRTIAARWDRLRTSPIVHPVLLAIFPIVFVWSHNLNDDIPFSDVALVTVITITGITAVYTLLRFVVRDPIRSGLAATAVAAIVLSYGHVVQLAEATPGSSRELVLLIGYLVLGAALVAAAVSAGARAVGATRVLNLVATVLVVMNLVPVAMAGRLHPGAERSAAWTIPAARLDAQREGPQRDVYYIIFDRYAGQQALRDLYGFDNAPFLDGLRDRGFHVVDDAVANYPQTTHSLSSSLNMTYLDDLGEDVGTDSGDWRPLFASLDDFTAARAFTSMGYQYDHIGSWFRATAADQSADVNYTYAAPQEFPGVFLRTTMVPYVAPRLGLGHFEDLFLTEYHRVAFQLAALRDVSTDPNPTFTFAHLTVPHPPYVFDRNGDYQPEGTTGTVEGLYLNQLIYTNTMISALVDDLLAGPDASDPIIVLQSDEGPHSPNQDEFGEPFDSRQLDDVEIERKLHILNAYYLPGLTETQLYPTITPVNTFRLILDDYFGANLPLLPDRTYLFEDDDHPYRFSEIKDQLGNG